MRRPKLYDGSYVNYEEDNYYAGWNAACQQWAKYFKWYRDRHWIIRKEKYYEIGDIVRIYEGKQIMDFIIAEISEYEIYLIAKDGTRYSNYCKVKNPLAITEDELKKIVKWNKFIVLKRGE